MQNVVNEIHFSKLNYLTPKSLSPEDAKQKELRKRSSVISYMKAGYYVRSFQRFSVLILLQYNEHISWKRLCHMIERNPLGLYFDIAVSIPVIFH